jgi:sugar phosphate isomerase/epimerase
MLLAVQHTLVPGETLRERFERAHDYGFDGVELAAWGFPGPMPDHRAEIEAAMAASGLPVSSLCSMGAHDFVALEPAERQQRLAGLVGHLQLADDLGAHGVVALPIRLPQRFPDLDPVADESTLISQLAAWSLRAAIARTPGLRAAILLEPLNRYEARFLRTLAQAAELCRAAGSPRVQIMADCFHMNIEEASLPAALEAARDHLGHLHLADSNRLLPGHGHTDFTAAFRALRRNAFSGWMALECGVPGEAAERLPRAVQYLRGCWQAAGE